MPTLAELVTVLSAKDDASPTIDKVKGSADRAKLSFTELNQAFELARKGLSLAKGAFQALVVDVGNAGDQIAKAARAAGVSGKELQRLEFAADRSGVATDELRKALNNLNAGMLDAKTKGVGPFADGLKKLGLTFADLQSLDAEGKIGKIGEALQGIADPAERSAIAGEIFGQKLGPKFASFLAEGTAGIKALGNEAERMGIVLGEQALADAEKFNDTWTDMQKAIQGVATTVGAALLPEVTRIAGEIKEWTVQNRGLIATNAKEFIEDLANVATTLGPPLLEAAKATAELSGALSFALGPESSAYLGIVALGAKIGGIPGLVAAAAAASYGIGNKTVRDLLGTDDVERQTKETHAKRVNIAAGSMAFDVLQSDEAVSVSQDVFDKIAAQAQQGAREAGDTERLGLIRRRILDLKGQRETFALEQESDARQSALIARKREELAKKKPAKGGGKKGDDIKIGPGSLVNQPGPTGQSLAESITSTAKRAGATEKAIKAALLDAEKSLQEGADRSVARKAAFGKLESLTGQKFELDSPLLRKVLGDGKAEAIFAQVPKGVQPQTVVVNNTYHQEAKIEVNGTGDPHSVGQDVLRVVQDFFRGEVKNAGRNEQVAFAR